MALRLAKMVQGSPRSPQEGPKIAQDGSNMASRGPQDGPGWLQYGLKRTPKSPKKIQYGQFWPKVGVFL